MSLSDVQGVVTLEGSHGQDKVQGNLVVLNNFTVAFARRLLLRMGSSPNILLLQSPVQLCNANYCQALKHEMWIYFGHQSSAPSGPAGPPSQLAGRALDRSSYSDDA